MGLNLYRRFGKRVIDLAVGLPALILLLPFLGLVALLIRWDSQGPALFIQERLGRHGDVFRLFKFRTMTHQMRHEHREILSGNEEVTRYGRWLRRLKIDELPQLYNVVRGDLSLVGPRPPLPAQRHEYDAVSARRLLVRPGLTGAAQIHGNIHLTWPERWRYDVLYVERLSLRLDIWILWRTLILLFAGEDKMLGTDQGKFLHNER